MKPGVSVTLDSNVFPPGHVMAAGKAVGAEFYVVSVTVREQQGTSFEAQVRWLPVIPEVAVWGESRWDESVYGSDSDDEQLNQILAIMGSDPLLSRENLTRGQRSQLRDATWRGGRTRAVGEVLTRRPGVSIRPERPSGGNFVVLA